MVTASASTTTTGARPARAQDARVWDLAATVCDPEIPVLTIEDLGILRTARDDDGAAVVELTPTYSGCPAMGTLRDDVTAALEGGGYDPVVVRLVLAPAWTTDWMSQDGRRKLEEYGIAPPVGGATPRRAGPRPLALSVKCPRCGSLRTRELSRFGSTSCKALHVCDECLEPFDYFRVI